MKTKLTLLLTALLTLTALGDNVKVINPTAQPVPVTTVVKTSATATAGTPGFYAAHITTKTTTHAVVGTAYVTDIAICVTGAGTTQTLTIVNLESTAKTIYTAGTAIAVGNTYIHFNRPVLMTDGIDIITGGTTAGTQDIWINYFQ